MSEGEFSDGGGGGENFGLGRGVLLGGILLVGLFLSEGGLSLGELAWRVVLHVPGYLRKTLLSIKRTEGLTQAKFTGYKVNFQ